MASDVHTTVEYLATVLQVASYVIVDELVESQPEIAQLCTMGEPTSAMKIEMEESNGMSIGQQHELRARERTAARFG